MTYHPSPITSTPWHLAGAAVLLPQGWRLLALVHYESSPVGPYEELAVAALTWRGPMVVQMDVTSAASRAAGRCLWGFPKEVRPLRWQQHGGRVSMRAGRACYNVRAWGPSWPVRWRGWCAQQLDGRWVRVPFTVSGRARLAWQGRRIALLIEPFVLDVFEPLMLPDHEPRP